MLTLDEKRVRKGKPIGLPYLGSKKKISKRIVEIIKQNFGVNKPVYDIFGGGGAITAECILNGLEVHYNDLDKTITGCFIRVIDKASDTDWLNSLIVSRDEFFRVRDKKEKTIDDHLKLLVNSFGNKKKNYLYNVEMSDIKYQMALEVLRHHSTYDNYKKSEVYIKTKKELRQLEQLQRLQQLERLQQLQHIGQLHRFHKITSPMFITSRHYREFSEVENAIIYLDPPYENTRSEYEVGGGNNFNHKDFYEWAYEMSKHNVVIVSSYAISDSRFSVVYEFKKSVPTIAGGNTNRNKYEKLFMVIDNT